MPRHEELRARVVAETRSWVGTPYHTGGRVKGAGCDCASFIYCVMVACGVFGEEEIGRFSPDAWAHWSEDKYRLWFMRRVRELASTVAAVGAGVEPGNIILCRAGGSKFYNHGAIIVGWPNIIHAVSPKVGETSATWHPMWAQQKVAVFDPFEKDVQDVQVFRSDVL